MKESRYFFSMNSLMFVEIDGDSKRIVQKLLFQIIKDIGIFEKKWSIFSDKSTIHKLNKCKNRWRYVEPYTADILKKSYIFTCEKEKKFSLFSGIYASAWKIALLTQNLPEKSDIEKLCERHRHADMLIRGRFVRVNEENSIDLGSCAKGYVAGYIKEKYMNTKGINSMVLNLGGNILVYTKEDIGKEVKIKNPVNNTYITLSGVRDLSIVTSGDYIQCFSKDGKKYHHIIDMNTGYPAYSTFCSVTVCHKDGFLCDCLATYYYIKGLDAIEECERDGIAAVFIFKNGDKHFTTEIKKKEYILDV